MDDIPKIELNRVHHRVVIKQDEKETSVASKTTEEPMTRQNKKKTIIPLIFIIFLALIGGSYAVFSSFITWNDGEEIETSTSTSSIPSNLKPANIGEDLNTNRDEQTTEVQVKGKITASLTREKGLPFEGGAIRLLSSGGKVIKEVETGKTGVAVFDQIAAGSYKVEGGKIGENRVTTQSVNLGEGEIKDVTLAIYIDTEVAIVVNVKNPDGNPASNQAYTLRKIRSSEEPLDYSVTTNDSGVFTKSGISPDNNWLLLKGEIEVGSFSVAPTGKNQTINVQTKSN